jgi:hypothetical protein
VRTSNPTKIYEVINTSNSLSDGGNDKQEFKEMKGITDIKLTGKDN